MGSSCDKASSPSSPLVTKASPLFSTISHPADSVAPLQTVPPRQLPFKKGDCAGSMDDPETALCSVYAPGFETSVPEIEARSRKGQLRPGEGMALRVYAVTKMYISQLDLKTFMFRDKYHAEISILNTLLHVDIPRLLNNDLEYIRTHASFADAKVYKEANYLVAVANMVNVVLPSHGSPKDMIMNAIAPLTSFSLDLPPDKVNQVFELSLRALGVLKLISGYESLRYTRYRRRAEVQSSLKSIMSAALLGLALTIREKEGRKRKRGDESCQYLLVSRRCGVYEGSEGTCTLTDLMAAVADIRAGTPLFFSTLRTCNG